jgi:hypothetical protein
VSISIISGSGVDWSIISVNGGDGTTVLVNGIDSPLPGEELDISAVGRAIPSVVEVNPLPSDAMLD